MTKEAYYWTTDEPLTTTASSMSDYIEHHLPPDWEVEFLDGSYAEFKLPTGKRYAAYAGGDGDFCSHVVKLRERLP